MEGESSAATTATTTQERGEPRIAAAIVVIEIGVSARLQINAQPRETGTGFSCESRIMLDFFGRPLLTVNVSYRQYLKKTTRSKGRQF